MIDGTFNLYSMVRAVFDEHGPRTSIQRAVMGALMRRADGGGQCYPGLTRIAREAGCKRTAAREALTVLAEDGWFDMEDREGDTYMFTLRLPTPEERARVAAEMPTPPADGPPPSVWRTPLVRQADPSAKRTPPPNGRGGIRQTDGGGPPNGPKLSQGTTPDPGSQIPPTPRRGGGTTTAGSESSAGKSTATAIGKKIRERKVHGSPMPEGWAPLPSHFEKGLKRGFDEARVRLEAELFSSHHASTGKTFVDWNAAFFTWLGKEEKFAAERAETAGAPGAIFSAGGPKVREITAAYAAGISADGWAFSLEQNVVNDLREIVKAHALTASGAPIPPGEILGWVKATATAYRRATQANAQYQSGFQPVGCMRWLNAGKPAEGDTRPRGSAFAEKRAAVVQRGSADAAEARTGTRADIPQNAEELKL